MLSDQIKPILQKEAEFGFPGWVFGQRSYVLLPNGHILAVYNDPQAAGAGLAVVNTEQSTLTRLNTGLTSFDRLNVAEVDGKLTVVTVASSASKAQALVMLQVG